MCIRDRWTEKGGTLFTATPHPAALLRNPSQKPAAFGDFIEMCIRDRSYSIR